MVDVKRIDGVENSDIRIVDPNGAEKPDIGIVDTKEANGVEDIN